MFEIIRTEDKQCDYNSRSWYDYHDVTNYRPIELAKINYLEAAKSYPHEPDLQLHRQPEAVLNAVVNLANILRKKNLIDDSEYLTVLGVEYNHEEYEVKEEK